MSSLMHLLTPTGRSAYYKEGLSGRVCCYHRDAVGQGSKEKKGVISRNYSISRKR